MVNDYQAIIESLKAKGIGAYFQKEDLLVISNDEPAVPSSNTFRVTNRNGIWYMATWLPAIYEVPENQKIDVVCESIYRSSPTAIYTIEEELKKGLGLRRLTDEEAEKLGF